MSVITQITIVLLVFYAMISLGALMVGKTTRVQAVQLAVGAIALWLATSAAYFGMTELTSNAPFPFWPAATIGGIPAYADVVLMIISLRSPHVHSWEVVSEESGPEMEYIPQMNADYSGGDEYYPTGKMWYRRQERCLTCGDQREFTS